MRDARLIGQAAKQYNRVSRSQLSELGYSDHAIQHRLNDGRLVVAEPGVFAVAPLLDDDRGRWMGATLTAPETYLSQVSSAAAHDFWDAPRHFETVTRPGSGGPRRFGGVLVFRSILLAGDTTTLGPIPITTPERTLIDLAAHLSEKALAAAVRDAVRVGATSLPRITDCLARHRGRRGCAHLRRAITRYSGLPLQRARSGAEVRALEIIRDARRPLPQLNVRIAGEEADLVWRDHRLIIEIDGGPFHLDVGEDARKQAAWERAGYTVHRLPSAAVYESPYRLLALAPLAERP